MRHGVPNSSPRLRAAGGRRLTDETERIAGAYRGYAKDGTKRWSLANRGNRMALQERQRAVKALLGSMGLLPLGTRRVLDVGCGAGAEMARLAELGAEPSALTGIELLPERVASAHERFPELDVRVGNAEHIDWADASFDLVLAYTVFSSILDNVMARNVAAEIERVLKPGGVLLWYDFRYDNPRNPNVRKMSESMVRSLFPAFRGELRPITLLPPVSRRLGVTAPMLYAAMAALPPLRSHLLGALVKDGRT
jgi:ubiquinone/menaquinone biosynthesis C-methylase UbiE